MEELMQKRIEQFNQFVINLDLSDFPIGLYYGKMGLCIYFYELSRFTSDNSHLVFAEKLLDDIVDGISDKVAIDPENGLTGICLAINYLLSNGFAEGDPNKVLKDFDSKIIHSLLFNQLFDNDKNLSLGTINLRLGSLIYLSIRLENKNISKEERLIIENVLVENINKIEAMETDKFTEPVLFSVTGYFSPLYLQLLTKVYKLDFYNYKIDKIINSLTPHLLYRFPLNRANRMLLCASMEEATSTFKDLSEWSDRVHLLKQDSNIPQTINEFRNKNIAFSNGLCGFYYLLKRAGNSRQFHDFFIDKIERSEKWESLSEEENVMKSQIGLYGGLPGIILTYMDILRREEVSGYFDTVIRKNV
jgi:hypothetical protein